MGNASGVFTVQSIRRRSADDRYDVETLMSVTGVPWDPQTTKLDEACLDKQARHMKGTLPEGPSWDKVWWRVPREFKTGNIIKSEPMDPSLGDEVVNAPMIDDMDIVSELRCPPTGEVAPSLPTAGAPVAAPTAKKAAESTLPSGGASSSSTAASAKRAGGEREERLEMSPAKGQKRPMDSGGETSKAKDSRAASAQASKGTKRPPENERPDDIDQCLMDLINEDRDKYLQSIEGDNEPVEEMIPLPPEVEDEAATWYYIL